ncbi:hypothetical protein G7K_1942-t1 [Saitoella complicata NRRL Y-17804]|uniref:Uncharacterized protein n=1 Tax=Saitoella complicata (strain BCRC 22490 / CBS 7301 / JCM 7358 / NBRC 10748 / NRRL Y-17804) TaxID=698492 RepID=A0A0E9ND62_SAICN|nr:hypothetical protein G7K_1942-t1 [Saitoella complicata NRRL Y-17804]
MHRTQTCATRDPAAGDGTVARGSQTWKNCHPPDNGISPFRLLYTSASRDHSLRIRSPQFPNTWTTEE